MLTTLFARPALADESTTFDSPRYGVSTRLPAVWNIVQRDREDRVFVALLARDGDPDRPGVVACEIGVAPESLYEYANRIGGNARQGRAAGRLVRNEVVATPRGPRLETLHEFQPADGPPWIERNVRIIANRQLYRFLLNTDRDSFARHQPGFDTMLDTLSLSPPQTGAVPVEGRPHRWLQEEFQVALDLPPGWEPVLAPSEVALLFARAPAHGVWSDNCLVLAKAHGREELETTAQQLPDLLRAEDPGCEVLQCVLVQQAGKPALETVVRTRRGPFTMTVLERRFRGDRFDYEIKFTLESDHFEQLAPSLRGCLDSFEERPGSVPGAGKPD